MKVLVIGSGGREHALVWKIAQEEQVSKIFAAPGNAGISEIAQCIDIQPTEIDRLAQFAQGERIDLTVVGGETPLVLGITNEFQRHGLPIFGPTREAALVEGSKVFAKKLMERAGIPQAHFRVFSKEEKERAYQYIQTHSYPLVVKADGLAAGKGAIVCSTRAEAEAALQEILIKGKFGRAGDQVVIEEYLEGEEVSLLAFTDGEEILPMVSVQDHKQVFDGDRGPNTGGMGAYSPVRIITPSLEQEIEERILQPLIKILAKEGRKYKGVIYAGLMITHQGAKVLEFNARFGDPETQVILPQMESPLIDILFACLEERLNKSKITWRQGSAVCVVLASGGYPGEYQKGKEIKGLSKIVPGEEVVVFHAGTRKENGKLLTNGGRVLGVTALGSSLEEARNKVYQVIKEISFEGMHYRKDIGMKGLKGK
jgi:phosphoribosylamine--glycine ligase